MKEEDAFDKEIMRQLHTMYLVDAIQTAIQMLTKSRTKETKKRALIRDVTRAKTSKEVCRIMWMAQLAGDGMFLEGSVWQSTFGSMKSK